VCLITEPNIAERYLIILSPFAKCHSFMFVFNCKFRQHSFCMDTNTNHFSIFIDPIVWISLVVLQSSLLIYWGFFAVPLWQHQSSLENTQVKASDISSPTLKHHY
jgi:hypothetical protein